MGQSLLWLSYSVYKTLSQPTGVGKGWKAVRCVSTFLEETNCHVCEEALMIGIACALKLRVAPC